MTFVVELVAPVVAAVVAVVFVVAAAAVAPIQLNTSFHQQLSHPGSFGPAAVAAVKSAAVAAVAAVGASAAAVAEEPLRHAQPAGVVAQAAWLLPPFEASPALVPLSALAASSKSVLSPSAG